MGEMIWIEILSHHHREVLARHRCDTSEFRIGRGYDNDVVIDDPYVAANHLLIRRDETGTLVAEDLGSLNGTFAQRGRKRLQRFRVNPDRPIRIGQTHLRIRPAGHPVPRERPLATGLPSWPFTVVLAVALFAMMVLTQWLGETNEPQLHTYVESVMMWAGIVVAWTSVWAVLSRVFSRRSRFEQHLKIALGMLLLYTIYRQLLQVGAYSFSLTELQTYQYVGTLCLLATGCLLHLRTIGPSLMLVKGGVLAALVAIVVAAQVLSQSEMLVGNNQQSYVQQMMPPTLRLAPLRSEDSFFARAGDLKPNLDRDRTKELPPLGNGGFLPGG